MMEYAKVILPKVCCWKNLFKKELLKCVEWAKPRELNELIVWSYDNFSDMYPDVLHDVFSKSAKRNHHGVNTAPLNSGHFHKKQIKRTKANHLPNSLPVYS